ncbi:MAG: mannose-1-phosphate guanylyltransferase [Chloroflexi bacterium]|nr:mannose-1-phosphate guanylyltransferase [Chloroflexota bacterium]
MLYAVIMAGGSGTRLWPLSRKGLPKQALRLIGDRTMFQHAVDRLAPLFPPERIFVVTNAAMAEVLRPQTLELPAANFILEPSPRDSAPAAGLAAVTLLARDPDATMVILTADHYIVDTAQFRAALAAADEVAADGTIVTLGIRPSFPSTGFGYIRLGESQIIVNGFRVYRSAGFIEKPDLPTASRFLEEGRYTWNSGMFIWRADRLLAEFASQLPESHAALMRIGAAVGTPDANKVLAVEWPNVRKISIDYGVMEHAANVSVIPVDIGWSDIGSWAALLDVLPGDEHGNVLSDDVLALDSRGSYVRSESGRLVALVGMQDVVVVDTPDALLICPRKRAQDVRDVVNRLAADGKQRYL